MKFKFTKEQLDIECASRFYIDYVELVHGGRWIRTRVGEYVTNAVQGFLEMKSGNAFDILVISLPPQHGKSMMITETLPSWYLCKNPFKRVIEISFNDIFAQKFGRSNMLKIREFGKYFGVELASSPCNNNGFELSNHVGSMISRGIDSGVTGSPGDLMIIDDPIKNRQVADSETYRERLKNEWLDSYRTRLSAGAKVIVIQTRWHEDDLAGYLIKNESNVKVINIPCEAGEEDILGRAVGDALCPELGKDNVWLADYKPLLLKEHGRRTWNALFQGNPVSEQGNLFLRHYWKYYEQLPSDFSFVLLSVDCTFKSADDSDFVAIEAWGKIENRYYLIDLLKKRLGFVDTIKAIEVFYYKYRPNQTLVEDKANGSAVIEVLTQKFDGLIPVEPKGGKVARANAVLPLCEAGNVYLPKFSSFTSDFIDDCAKFPFAENDDTVDSMSQGLTKLRDVVVDNDSLDIYDGTTDILGFSL